MLFRWDDNDQRYHPISLAKRTIDHRRTRSQVIAGMVTDEMKKSGKVAGTIEVPKEQSRMQTLATKLNKLARKVSNG